MLTRTVCVFHLALKVLELKCIIFAYPHLFCDTSDLNAACHAHIRDGDSRYLPDVARGVTILSPKLRERRRAHRL